MLCHSAPTQVSCSVRTICVCSVRWRIIVFALWEANSLWYACTPCSFLWQVVWLSTCRGKKKKEILHKLTLKSDWASKPSQLFRSSIQTCFVLYSVRGLRESESSTFLRSFIVIRTIYIYSAFFCQEALKPRCEFATLIILGHRNDCANDGLC